MALTPPAYVSHTISSSGSNSLNYAIDKPPTVIAGELLILDVIWRTATPLTLTGGITSWNVINTQLGDIFQKWTLWRPLRGDEPASWTFSSQVSTTFAATVTRYSNADLVNPIGDFIATFPANTTGHVFDIVTAREDNSLLVSAISQAATNTYSGWSPLTERVAISQATNPRAMGIGTQTRPTAGPTTANGITKATGGRAIIQSMIINPVMPTDLVGMVGV